LELKIELKKRLELKIDHNLLATHLYHSEIKITNYHHTNKNKYSQLIWSQSKQKKKIE